MDRGKASVFREYCPKLLCYWSEEKALEFVEKCSDMNEIEICWLWDWFLLQIKGNDPPSCNISLIIANFLLKRLPKSHKIPSFAPLKLITIQDDSNIIQMSNIVMEIADRNPSTAPSLLVKPLNDVLLLKSFDSDHFELVSSLSYLLLKSLNKYNPKASYKAVESILLCDIEVIQRFFRVDNFLSLILFTVSDPFHKGMSTFYNTENYLKYLNLSKETNVISVENYQHSIFYHLIHWSEHLSIGNISYLFYKIHDHYINSFETSIESSKFESERDKLCFGAFIIALFCRNINSKSKDLFEFLYLILCKSNEVGLFSIVPLDNEPLHVIKSIKLPFKLFNQLLQIAENSNKDEEITISIWKNIKLLFEINLHQIDLKYFVSLLSGCFYITEAEFSTNVHDSLQYVLDSYSFIDDNNLCNNIYLDTLITLVSSLYKLGDLPTFFDTLSENIQFDFILHPCILKIIQRCANESTDSARVFESLIRLMDKNNDIKLTITLRILISSFLFSINIKDNLPSKTFVSSLFKFVNQYNIKELYDNNELSNISLYLFVLSLFITIRKIEACFTYTNNYTPFKVNDLINLLFTADKLVNLKSDLASYQLKLCGLSLIHISLYYATRMFNNEDLWVIDSVTNLFDVIYKLSLDLSFDDIKRFYLLYMLNPHLFDIYGIKLQANIGIISQILYEYPKISFNPALVKSMVNEELLCEVLDPTRLINMNILGLSQLILYIDNPSSNILNRIIKCLDSDVDKVILLNIIEKLSDKKSLQHAFASYMFNELIYPLDKQICSNCQDKCEELDNIKKSLNECDLQLFNHLNDKISYLLIEKSLKHITYIYFKTRDCDEYMLLITYQLLRRLCNFELPTHVSTNCNYCGIYIKRKDVFLHVINSLYKNCSIFRDLQNYKRMNKYISLLLCGSMKLENNLIAITNYINRNLSLESLEICIGFIRLIAMDGRQINQQLSLEILEKVNGLDISINNIISLGPIVGSVNSLIEYLNLIKSVVLNFDNSVYSVIKNVIQNDHLKIGEDILNLVNTRFISNNRVDVILKLFVCDSILKASRGMYNPSGKTKGDLFNIIIEIFKDSIDYIINNDKVDDSGEIYIYICKITCSLYYRMRKSSLFTIGYINVNNHVLICDLLIYLSTLVDQFKHYNPNLVAKHSYMCIYSLLNYGNGASQAQVLRLLNIWVNKIPDVIRTCKNLIEISFGFDGVKLLLDIVKLMRNKKIIKSTKRYIPLLLTLILKRIRLMDMGDVDNSYIMLSIKRQLQLSLEACGPKIVQEWSYDMPNNLRIYLKHLEIKLSSYSKYKNL